MSNTHNDTVSSGWTPRARRLVPAVLLLAALSAATADARGATGVGCPAWVDSATSPAASVAAKGRSTSAALPSVAYQENGIAVGPTKASLGASVSPGDGSRVVIQYGRTSAYRVCSATQRLGTGSGARAVEIVLAGLQPDTSYHFRLVAKTPAGPVVGAYRTFRTLAAGHIPQRVEVGSVALGGMSRGQALAVLARPVASPLRLSYAGAFWHVSRVKAGARLDAKRALASALTAAPGQTIPAVTVAVDRARLRAYVASLDRRWSRRSEKAAVRLVGKHAVVTSNQPGVEVDTRKMTGLIAAELTTGGNAVLPLAVTTGTAAPAGPEQKAVVVRLGSQTLTAYLNGKPVLQAPITTGRPALPTPIGSYYIHFRASPYTFVSPWPPGSPYWYPPAPVTWAMYFFDNDFLHDDPAEPGSAFGAGSEYGPYASHGCVHVPHDTMAYLYDWLPVGSTVIVSQT